MAYTPNALPTLWSTISTKFTEFSPVDVNSYNTYDGALLKFNVASYEYEATATYTTGEYCYYTSAGTTSYYKANQDITTPEAFTPAHWDAKTTAQYISDAASSVTISSQFGAGASVDYAPVANSFDATSSYPAGDMVIYDGKMYRANEAIAPGTFDPTKWTLINVAGKLKAYNDQLADNVAPVYSTAGVYSEGSYVVYANPASQIYKLYKAKEDGITGAWDATKWDEISVSSELFRAKSSSIAAKISPSTVYSVGDYATYLDELYKVTTAIPAYDASAGTYAVGDYVEQDGKFYCCKTAITTPEAFDASKWDVKTSGDTITACFSKVTVTSQLNGGNFLYSTAAAPDYSASTNATYAIGDYCTHEHKLYRCTKACPGGTWDTQYWTEVDAMGTTSGWNTNVNTRFAPLFSTTSTYNEQDYVTVMDAATGKYTLYKARQDYIPAGTFDPTMWQEVTLDSQFQDRPHSYSLADSLDPNRVWYAGQYFCCEGWLSSLKKPIKPYNDELTYAVGDHVSYDSKFYRCKTAITTPEAFDATKWDEKTDVDIANDSTMCSYMCAADSLAVATDSNCIALPISNASTVNYTTDGRDGSSKYINFNNGYIYKCKKDLMQYDTTTSYAVDDYCINSNRYYKCITACSGTWDATKWLQVSDDKVVAACFEFVSLSDDIKNYDRFVAPEYDSTATYTHYNCWVWHDGELYTNMDLITTPEAWTEAHWYKLERSEKAYDLMNDCVHRNDVAPDFYDGDAYESGDTALYDNIFYQAKKHLSAGAFDRNDWYEMIFSEIIRDAAMGDTLTEHILFPSAGLEYKGVHNNQFFYDKPHRKLFHFIKNAFQYCPALTYAVGDLVHDYTNNCYWKCTTAITTPEAWTEAHWTKCLTYEDLGSTVTYLDQEIGDRLNANSVNQNFESITPRAISVGEHVTFNSKLYKCTTEIKLADATTVYNVGDIVVYNSKYLICTGSGTASTGTYAVIDSSDYGIVIIKCFTEVNVDFVDASCTAPAFSTASTYQVGDTVSYYHNIYRCKVAVTTAGVWTASANWVAIDVDTEDKAELAAMCAALGLTRTVTYNTTTNKFEYSYSISV